MFAEKFIESRFKHLGAEELGIRGFSDQLKNCDREKFNRMHSNTTVFALKFKNGVLIAGDRRMSDGFLGIVSDDTLKVKELAKYSAMACAGFCNIISFLETNMTTACSTFKSLYGQDLSPDGQANFLRNLLEPWWFMSVYTWYWAVGIPILATYDMSLGMPRIFVFDDSGFNYEPEFFGGAGCGFEAIRGLVVDHWRLDMNEDFALMIAMKAMLHSGAISHGVSDARLKLPTMAVINEDGFRWIPDELLKKALGLILERTEGLK